jgi:hypothetical protein
VRCEESGKGLLAHQERRKGRGKIPPEGSEAQRRQDVWLLRPSHVGAGLGTEGVAEGAYLRRVRWLTWRVPLRLAADSAHIPRPAEVRGDSPVVRAADVGRTADDYCGARRSCCPVTSVACGSACLPPRA